MDLSPEKIASVTGGELGQIVETSFTSFASLHKAHKSAVSFSTAEVPGITFTESKAGCILVPLNYKNLSPNLFAGKTILYCKSPYHAMIQLMEEFYPNHNSQKVIHPTATIHESAVVEGEVEERCIIGPHCVVMEGAVIEAGTTLEAHVTVYPRSIISEQCVIQAGVVIGSRGFGFYEYNGEQRSVPHFGGVHIGPYTTIGAQSVIAAGFIEPTTIGTNCHLDSFVQIGHNVTLGNHCMMVSQSGIAGSTVVAERVSIGGGAQIAGHLTIGSGASIAAKSGVTKNIPANMTVAGFPAVEISKWRQSIIDSRKSSP